MMAPLNSETNNIFLFFLFAAIIIISITIIAGVWISVFKRPKITTEPADEDMQLD